jgi:hypothetical protein
MACRLALLTPCALLVFVLCGELSGQDTSPLKNPDKPKVVDDPTKAGDRLRRPGFLFLELDCRDLADHIAFFKSVAGFDVKRRQGSFVVLRSAHGEILLNGVGGAAPAKPVRYQGPRVEIGIVVGDLDQAFAQAKEHKQWPIQAGIARQPWGVRDFRVFSPEGYYFRITEGPK